ncbi:unnamed protein product [Urochloa humidicola]
MQSCLFILYIGDDTALGRANQERKCLFEDLAFAANRIQYMVEAEFKDHFLKTCKEKLRRQFDKVNLNVGEGYLIIPADLHKAVIKILTDTKIEKEEHKRKMEEDLKKMKTEESLRQLELQERQRLKKEKEKAKKQKQSWDHRGCR